MANYRTILTIAVPAVTALFGLLWFFGRKKKPVSKPNAEPPDKPFTSMRKEKPEGVIKKDTKQFNFTESGRATPDKKSEYSSSREISGSAQTNKPAFHAREASTPGGDNDPYQGIHHTVSQTVASSAGDSSPAHMQDVVPEIIQEEIVKPMLSKTVESHRGSAVCDVSDDDVKVSAEIIIPTQELEVNNPTMISSHTSDQTRQEVSTVEAIDDNSRLTAEMKFENANTNNSLETDAEPGANIIVNNLNEETPEVASDTSVVMQKQEEEQRLEEHFDLMESSVVQQSPSTSDIVTVDLKSDKDHITDHTNSDSLSKDSANVLDLTNGVSVIDLTGNDHVNSKTESQLQNHSEISTLEKQAEDVATGQSCENNSQSENHQEVNNHSDSSSNCDNLSEASNDSGKGASVNDNAGLSPSEEDRIYEFSIPSDMCGLFIGTKGKTIKSISQQSATKIRLQNYPYTRDSQRCVIEGSQSAIDKACKIIQKRFPSIQLSAIEQPIPPHPVIMPEIMQLSLPMGVSVDIVVSSIVDAGRIFVQQPTHPTFPSLDRLNTFMNQCYMQEGAVPDIPRPIESGVICAAPMLNGWYRAQIMASYEEAGECDIKYVDYGGYSRISSAVLKQIRSDFMTLPFEAVECYLANIIPLESEEYFSTEAAVVLEELTQGKLLQAQVVGRAEDGIPYVNIYQIYGSRSALLVNREMVNRGVVRWQEMME